MNDFLVDNEIIIDDPFTDIEVIVYHHLVNNEIHKDGYFTDSEVLLEC